MRRRVKCKNIIGLLLALIMILSSVGCGGKDGDNDDKSKDNGGKRVEISYWNSGMGTEFLDAMVDAFNEKQSDWYVQYKATADIGAVMATYGLDDVDTIDLYMGTKVYDTSKMAQLDELLDSALDGESKKLKEKFNDNYMIYEQATDGHYYTLTWGGGAVGLVYNKELFERAGITELPRTTNELAKVCDTLLKDGITPLSHFGGDASGGYWYYIYHLWQAQYDGIDYYLNNFWSCTDKDGKNPSIDVLTAKDGRYQVLKAMEKFITPEYVLNGSNSQDHITMQTQFLNQDIGMIANGSWMVNEMKGVGKTDKFGVMKTPVLSAITDKLTTVKGDTELRKLISAIDEVTDGLADISKYQSGNGYLIEGKEISKEDWDYVYNARNMVGTNNPAQTVFVPSYSEEKEGAMEFLKFFYSDEGYKIYTDTIHVLLPMKLSEGEIDTSGWNDFEKDMFYLNKNATTYVSDADIGRHAIFTDGGAKTYASYNFVQSFCSNNATERVTADEAWDAILDIINSQYKGWLENIK